MDTVQAELARVAGKKWWAEWDKLRTMEFKCPWAPIMVMYMNGEVNVMMSRLHASAQKLSLVAEVISSINDLQFLARDHEREKQCPECSLVRRIMIDMRNSD